MVNAAGGFQNGARGLRRRTTMAKHSNANFEIPPEMRALADESVEQARQAFGGFVSAAQEAKRR